jgi:small subunit ribosomal protein S20
MPNTKSAEQRMRQSTRRHAHNQTISSRLKTLEKRYEALVATKKRDDAKKALAEVSSALDKAAKTGVIHRGKADRKKSRLAIHLAKLPA